MVPSRTDLQIKIAALYRFAPLPRCRQLQEPLRAFCERNGIRGTLILAPEGINGTVAGADPAIDSLVAFLETDSALAGLEIKFSRAAEMPFHRMKVRIKREIVTMGVDGIDPVESAGDYVEPGEWNRLIDDPDTVVIDTRNAYETALGTFEGALDPGTASFREFPAWAAARRGELVGRKVAMFCTGGIRCEKATAYMKSIGVEQVFHLRGGILKYLEQVSVKDSRWRGECFVFDERVSVTHGLGEGSAELCRACRRPLTPADRASSLYEAGVSCPQCHGERSHADRERYAERQRQVEFAALRGGRRHIGQRDRSG